MIKYDKQNKTIDIGMIEVEIALNMSKTTVTRLINSGMRNILNNRRPMEISLPELIKWYIDNEVLDDKKAKAEEANIKLKQSQDEKLQLQIRELEGSLISIVDSDQSMAQLAALLVSQYKQLLVSLPPLLKKKNESDISEILDELFEQNIEDLYSLAVEEEEIFEKRHDEENTEV